MSPSTPLRRGSTAASSVAGDSTPGTPLSARSRLQTLAIETLLSSTMASVSATPPRLPVAKNKEPLSLPTTTRNFRGFVQKSGPIFYFQDAVEATLAWDDWAWTSMWMGIWAVVALQPYLLLCAPTAILAIILIRTHMARFPVGRRADGSAQPGAKSFLSSGKAGGSADELITPTPSEALEHAIKYPTSTGHGAVRPPVMPNPPHEGTIKYYENLRDIQNMMKMVTDGYDAIAPAVPFLNWSSYRRTLLLFQASMILTVVMFFFGPLIPIRPILLLAGEGAFIANHPWVKPAVAGLTKTLQEEKTACKTPLGRTLYQLEVKNREQLAALRQWYEEDGLDDTVWEKGWRDVEMYQNERHADANAASGVGWSAHNLRFGERKAFTKGSDGWTAQELDVAGYSLDIRQVAMSLEPGWAWVEGDDWRIDWVGQWSNVGVDAEGFVYTDSDWQAASPFAYGHPGQPRYPPTLRSDGRYGFSLSELLQKQSEHEGSVFEEDEDERAADLSLTGMEIRAAKAETRRRRWLRRAVWVGKSKLVEDDEE